MTHNLNVPALLGSLLVTALANAQTILAPRPVPLPARKIVTHDIGDFWPGTFVLHTNGTVTALGNAWLGGGVHSLPLTGIADMARLDALTPGASESVAMVGTSGLSMVRCNAAGHSYVITPWADPLLQGALAVRSAPFAPHGLVAVLTADGRTLRCHRRGGTLVGTFTMPAAVLDFDAFRHADGAARILTLTATGLSCTLLNGTVQWTAAGSGGDVVRWPNDPTIKAAWMHRDPSSGDWRIALLGDQGVLSVDDVSSTIAAAEQLLAAFAVDGDADGDIDWMVKTSLGTSVLVNGGIDAFSQAVEAPVPGLVGISTCIPDLAITHGGRRVRMLDEQALANGSNIAWANISHFGGGVWDNGISLHLGGTIDTQVESHSKIDFQMDITPEWLEAFVGDGLTTHVQLLAWRQAEPNPDGRIDDTAAPHVLFELLDIPEPIQAATRWPLDATIALPFPANSPGWDVQEHYWLTIRLVTTILSDPTRKIVSASEPITLGTTLSWEQRGNGWPFLLSYVEQGTPATALPRVNVPPPAGQSNGGGVVGVITRIVVPPPPPLSGIPAPGPTTDVKTSLRVPTGPY